MRISNAVINAAAVVASLAFAAPSRPAHDACTLLSGEAFSKIMGYAATVDKTGSTPLACYYNGPNDSGGQLHIMSEQAGGPGAEAMLHQPGSSPPAGSGMIGGTYKEGRVLFSISIISTDHAKLDALVAEVRKHLK